MNDRDARRLLGGIDAPRPMPSALASDLEALLTDGLPLADAPRPLPADLRARLEATLLGKPMPSTVHQRVAHAIRRPSPRILQAAAVLVAVTLLGGLLAGLQAGDDASPTAGGPDRPATRTTPTTGSGDSAGATASGTSGSVAAPPFASATGGSSQVGGADATPSGAGAAVTPAEDASSIVLAVIGDGTDVARGFDAYLRALDGAGGIGGRTVIAQRGAPAGAVATVNLEVAPAQAAVEGVLFETAFVEESRLRNTVVSMSSPIERQARLAVAHAVHDPPPTLRAAIYSGAREPWATVVPGAFESALRERGVTPVRVPFAADAPTFVPADVAFLSLDRAEVGAWVDATPEAPERGAWAVGSGWDDGIGPAAAAAGLHVLSPYEPIGGDERAALARRLPAGTVLSAGAVHGWVTAKAIAVLLARNGGTRLTPSDLDALVGWDPGWAPPFEVRPGTRARAPDAILLEPSTGGFTKAGEFERDGA